MKKFVILIFTIILLVPFIALAAPPLGRGRHEPPERPGIRISRRLAGKYHIAPLLASLYPATVNILFLRVDFQPDADPSTTGTGQWSDCTTACNNDPDYWVNNSKTKFINYWKDASYNNLTVNVTISPNIYTLNNPMSYYGNETSAALENLIYDSITTADNDIDFSLYAAVLIVHAGAGEEADINSDTTNDIWSLYYRDNCISQDGNNSNPCLTVDNTAITEAIIMPQTDSQDGAVVDPVGVYLHEFGHWLGLPDLYCTALVCLTDGVGDWSLMDSGTYNGNPYGSSPAHPDAWSKVFLGWVAPQNVSTYPDPGIMALNYVETYPEILKLPATSSTRAQYFLLENRQLLGFDAGLPGSGLLVWLIDDDVINQRFQSNTINNDRNHPGVKLIEADGDFALLNASDNDLGSAGDPYPGSTDNTGLTPVSNPDSAPYSDDAWVDVDNISINSGVASFDVAFSPDVPSAVSAVRGCSATTVSWTASTAPDLAAYRVYRNGVFVREMQRTSFPDADTGVSNVYSVSAIDTGGHESPLSPGVTPEDQCVSSGGGPNRGSAPGGGGGGCFIATAAYGSYLEPHVMVLREFRDRHLLTNAIGRKFVELYYRYSPPMADYIARHGSLRFMTRLALTPLVYGVKYPFVAGVFALILPAGLIVIYRKKGRA
ncbi:MAG TPA: M6 family metalloprotease domain-containing protein [Nitrospirae bacterium]|nr:M6 family metalloprotease domain-containing protein [Nitrospirota bacterium]